MTLVDEMRAAANFLRDSHRLDGIKVDSDSRETLELIRNLLWARDSLADLLDGIADMEPRWPAGFVPEEALAAARAINGCRS